MKYLFVWVLIFVLFTPAQLYHFVAHFDDVLIHYETHLQEDENTNCLNFIIDHLQDNHSHNGSNGSHKNLPFGHQHDFQLTYNNFLFMQKIQLSIQLSFDTLLSFWTAPSFYSYKAENKLWQPPRI